MIYLLTCDGLNYMLRVETFLGETFCVTKREVRLYGKYRVRSLVLDEWLNYKNEGKESIYLATFKREKENK